MLCLRYGLCSIVVEACDEVMGRHVQQVAQGYRSLMQTHRPRTVCTLMVISPYAATSAGPKWRAISAAWVQARQGLRDPHSQSLAAWRALEQFGKPVNPSVLLFEDRDAGQDHFFSLVPADTLRHPWQLSLWIIEATKAVALQWHVAHGGAPLHASGVARQGKGYLFLGPSGAGKSTVAGLSQQAQGIVIHDDQVVLSLHRGHYRIAYAGSHAAHVLQAVFLLRKGSANRLTPLSPPQLCASLSRALLQYAIGREHYGPWVRQAFHNVAAIARSVPGYQLHFRESPEFWDVIDAELGN